MAYVKTTWVDDAAPPVNAANLNKIEQGIYDAHTLKLDKPVAGGVEGQVLKYVSGAPAWASVSSGGFSATKGANQGGIAFSTFTKVTFDTEEFDAEGWYDPSTSRYTPQSAGWYWLGAVVMPPSGATYAGGTVVLIELWRNGTFYRRLQGMRLGSASDDWCLNGSVLVQANGTTDFFEIFFDQTTGAGASLGTSYFQGHAVK